VKNAVALPEALALALAVTVASHAVPNTLAPMIAEARPGLVSASGYGNLHDLVMLAYGLVLALSAPRASGLVWARPTARVAFVAALPVVITALVYPRLPVRPFAGQRVGMWLFSPFAQSAIFVGYLYGLFARSRASVGEGESEGGEPGRASWRPTRALVLTGVFFALWHAPNLASMPAGYVAFQFVYTFAAMLWTGLTRQWTGAVWYALAAHVCGNAIAWATS
jgi:membrane protease YdiL (CAAX protease family)